MTGRSGLATGLVGVGRACRAGGGSTPPSPVATARPTLPFQGLREPHLSPIRHPDRIDSIRVDTGCDTWTRASDGVRRATFAEAEEAPQMRISLYMLRRDTAFDRRVLRDGDRFDEVQLIPSDDVQWTLLVRPGYPKLASWVDNVKSVVVDESKISKLNTQSSSGVLLVKTRDWLFAVTFGHGYHAIDPKYIEPAFGLRVTANVLRTNGITGADTKGLTKGARSQKTILPAANELYALGVDPSEEWVRQLSGKVDTHDFATTASGADSLRLSIKDFSLDRLPAKLEQIADRYEANDYKEDFGFLDNFLRLDRKDPLVDELDNEVEAMLARQDNDLGFAAPDPFEQLAVDHYMLQYRRKVKCEQLSNEEVFAALGQFNIRENLLHRARITAYDESGQDIDKRYDLYDYVQAEITRPNGRYVLTSGAWFRVAPDYIEEVDSYVKTIEDHTPSLDLPPWSVGRARVPADKPVDEGAYNAEVAGRRNYALLDKENLYFGRNSKIEICDLLTRERELLCVKRASRSSTLSHLFAQASVSASLMNEPKYQERIMGNLKALGLPAEYGNPPDWTFVYAISTDKPGLLAESLFFFSKVNLVTHAKAIRSRGFKVVLAKIDMN